MKQVKKNIGCIILFAVVIANVCNPMKVNAAERVECMQLYQLNPEVMTKDEYVYKGIYDCENSPYMRGNNIVSASIGVTPRSNEILIDVYTGCNFVATKVGVKNVLVQEKVWYGWKTIATAGDYGTNAVSYAAQAHCTNAEKGKTYRVLCTHYAIDSSGVEHTLANQSEEFVYN